MPIKKTHEMFVQEVKDRYGDEYSVLGKYKTTHTTIKLRHNTCGHEWDTTAPYDFLKPKPNKCPVCAVQRSWPLTDNEFNEKLNSLYPNEYEAKEKYINNKFKINILHKSCGLIKKIKPNAILSGKYNCECISKLNPSIISKNIEELLSDLEICYEKEKTFNWLKLNSNLYIDFYLTDYKIGIEADGEQHYIAKRGGDDEFMKTLLRDKEKVKLCKKEGIDIIRIPSWLSRHQLRPFLTKILFEHDVLEFTD